MVTTIHLKSNKELLATIIVGREKFSVVTHDRSLKNQLESFLAFCFKSRITTFLEPEIVTPGKITITEKQVRLGDRGFLPALARRLRHIVPGSQVEVVDAEAELHRLQNSIRHQLASLPIDQPLIPAVQKIIRAVDKLNLEQAKEILKTLQSKDKDKF